MDITAVLQETDGWPLEDRIHLIEILWDRIVDSGGGPVVTAAQKAELDRRLADLDAHSEQVVPWEEVVTYVRRSR